MMKRKRMGLILALAVLFCSFPLAAQAGEGGTAINSITPSSTEITQYTVGLGLTPQNAVTVAVNADGTLPFFTGVFVHETDPAARLICNTSGGDILFRIDNSPSKLYGKGGPSLFTPGKYLLTSIYYGDGNGGSFLYGPAVPSVGGDATSNGPLPDAFVSVFVNLNLPADTTPPTVTGITVPNGTTVTPATGITATVNATDDVSGFSGAYRITYRSKGTGLTVEVPGSNGNASPVNASDWVNGEYEVAKVMTSDPAGNIATYEGAALAAIPGAGATFTVSGCSNTVLSTATDDAVTAAITAAAGTGTAENPAVLAVHYAEGDTALSPAIFEELAATPNVVLRVALANGLTWLFEGGTQAAPAAPVDVNVQFGQSSLYANRIDTAGDWGYVLDFPNNGRLPVTTSLFIPAWPNAPATASLYFVQADGSLQRERTGIALQNGGYTVPFTHNSSFLLSGRAPLPAPPASTPAPAPAAPGPAATPAPTTTPTSPQTGVYR